MYAFSSRNILGSIDIRSLFSNLLESKNEENFETIWYIGENRRKSKVIPNLLKRCFDFIEILHQEICWYNYETIRK